jgi:NADPH:quinone reductase-like Zn-dependent oxidoreductase
MDFVSLQQIPANNHRCGMTSHASATHAGRSQNYVTLPFCQNLQKQGGLAEYVVIGKTSCVVKLPDNVPFEEASGLPTTGVTALQALRDKAGMPLSGYKGRVLVMAASGGVGHTLYR